MDHKTVLVAVVVVVETLAGWYRKEAHGIQIVDARVVQRHQWIDAIIRLVLHLRQARQLRLVRLRRVQITPCQDGELLLLAQVWHLRMRS